MTSAEGVNIQALDAGYKVELRQDGAEIFYVFITPDLVESDTFLTAAQAWDAAYLDYTINS